MKTCIQIGLNTTTEYLYVTGHQEVPDENSITALPDNITDFGNEWMYYGVDSDVFSIQSLHYKFPLTEYPNVRFVLAAIERQKELPFMNSWFGDYGVFVPMITLNELITGLNVQDVDVLVLDVEGAEFHILNSYDWEIHPKFIAVEVHVYPYLEENVKIIKDIVIPQGYKLSHEEDTNIRDGISHTTELQFTYAP